MRQNQHPEFVVWKQQWSPFNLNFCRYLANTQQNVLLIHFAILFYMSLYVVYGMYLLPLKVFIRRNSTLVSLANYLQLQRESRYKIALSLLCVCQRYLQHWSSQSVEARTRTNQSQNFYVGSWWPLPSDCILLLLFCWTYRIFCWTYRIFYFALDFLPRYLFYT